MRQRNDTAYAWTLMSDPPVQVLPGEEHDHDVLLDGWTPVEDKPEPAADEPAAPKTTSRKRAAAADTDRDGGEPR
ncbi:hypothetical protein ACWDA7_30465 [Streptomyces sp. NPDC001156]